MFLFTLLLISTKKLGGFQKIELDNDYVTAAKSTLEQKMNSLFPEISNAELKIISAKIKVVRGAILKLKCKYAQYKFVVELTFPLNEKPQLTSFVPKATKKLVGGYKWIKVEDSENIIQNVIDQALKEQSLTAKPQKVLAARAQVLRGAMSVHVIFKDAENSIYSVMSTVSTKEVPEIRSFAKV